LKVCIDCVIFSLQKSGGITSYFKAYIDYLKKRKDISLTLIIYDDAMDFGSEVSYIRKRYNRFISYFNVSPPKGTDLFILSYYRLVAKQSAKNVFIVHDFMYEKFRSGLPLLSHVFLKKNSFLSADLLVFISKSTEKDYHSFYGHLDQIYASKVVLHNGVNEVYKPLEVSSKTRRPFLYVGARRGYKNFTMFVNIANSFLDRDIVIVGGDRMSRQELDSFINPNRVVHKTGLSDKALNVEYNNCSLLIYPSLYEGFGMPVLEAYRTRTLALGFEVPGLSEVLYPKHRIPVNLDLKQICKKIEGWLRDEGGYTLEACKVYEWSLKFTWEENFSKQINLTKRL
jgi:mannosyltransferase